MSPKRRRCSVVARRVQRRASRCEAEGIPSLCLAFADEHGSDGPAASTSGRARARGRAAGESPAHARAPMQSPIGRG
eukprot:COSAG02_NODE_9103_length_2329_cov_1.855605_3_plen_77_part_00